MTQAKAPAVPGFGLANYRTLLTLFGMSPGDYKRFLNCLAVHDCRVDFREFRNGAPDIALQQRLLLPPLATDAREAAAADTEPPPAAR